ALIANHLARSRVLAPLVARRRGLRVPGAWDGFELAVRAVLGQQVTVRGATTLAGRVVRAFGTPLDQAQDGLTHLFPQPEALAGRGTAGAGGGTPTARGRRRRRVSRSGRRRGGPGAPTPRSTSGPAWRANVATRRTGCSEPVTRRSRPRNTRTAKGGERVWWSGVFPGHCDARGDTPAPQRHDARGAPPEPGPVRGGDVASRHRTRAVRLHGLPRLPGAQHSVRGAPISRAPRLDGDVCRRFRMPRRTLLDA